MPIAAEDLARQNIDRLLDAAGWIIQNRESANITAGRGVAIREFPMKKGHGEADYLLFVDGAASGVIEAKRKGETLTGVEFQTQKYSEGVPKHVPCLRHPLPFRYQSTGVETRFTSLLDPEARSRQLFAFHARHIGFVRRQCRSRTYQWLSPCRTRCKQHPGPSDHRLPQAPAA